MLIIRLLAGLVAFIVVADFTWLTWRFEHGTAAIIPALIGALVTAALCWKDAAAKRQRERLAACVWLLAGCLAVSLIIEIVSRGGSANAVPQIVLLSVLALVTAHVGRNALVASRRRRERVGFHAYYQEKDAAFPEYSAETMPPPPPITDLFPDAARRSAGHPRAD